MVWMIGLKSILGWERLPLYGRYGYVGMIKYFPTKLFLFCRLSTGVLVLSVCGRLNRRWSIETCFWRSFHG
jgi:hypothetical protein